MKPTTPFRIPLLDEALAPTIESGGVVLIAAETGRGGTTVAAHLLRNCIEDSCPVRFLSNHNTLRDMILRVYSGLTDVPWNLLTRGDTDLPCPEGVNPLRRDLASWPISLQSAYHALWNECRHYLQFSCDRDLQYDPFRRVCAHLHSVLPGIEVVIIDRFDSFLDRTDPEPGWVQPSHRTMDLLREWAHARGTPVFVTCTASQELAIDRGCKLTPEAMDEYPGLVDHADVFLGVSGRLTDDIPMPPVDGIMSVREQFIWFECGDTGQLIPFDADYGFQRLFPREDVEPVFSVPAA